MVAVFLHDDVAIVVVQRHAVRLVDVRFKHAAPSPQRVSAEARVTGVLAEANDALDDRSRQLSRLLVEFFSEGTRGSVPEVAATYRSSPSR
jgi:hypothetical protein